MRAQRPSTGPSAEERLAPGRRPPGWSIGRQRWRQLLFLHWEAPAEALRPLVPAGLDLDTYEGRAYVGVTPFVLRDAIPWLTPSAPVLGRLARRAPLPGLSFLELNVRTYVHRGGRQPGVWFFSLDASSRAAVLAARAAFRLPYYHATMRIAYQGGWTHYVSDRRDQRSPGPLPGRFSARYRAGESVGTAEPGTLEHFFVERYLLYADWGASGLKVGQVHHPPYPLQRAQVEVDPESATLLEADRLPRPSGPPHALYSPGVDVEIFPLRHAP